ncbi:MAG: YraN family protein [Deltaproteobacteria bacterium]|nr:YraN family protein [Deltaproteobacteria bacterium]
MVDDQRHIFGRWGESEAALFLEGQGLSILERGFRCRFGEIDIIAQEGQILVFCEVKTRRRETFGAPQEAVSWTKQRRLIKTAGWYLNQRFWDGGLRFDVIAILASTREKPRLEWIRDAFAWE